MHTGSGRTGDHGRTVLEGQLGQEGQLVTFIAQETTSTDVDALVAVVVIVAGFVLGSVAAAVARRVAGSDQRPDAIQTSAGAIATLAFSIILIVALVIALGIVNRTALDELSSDLVSFLPKALSAAIVLILGNVVGAVAETGVERSLGHVSPEVRRRVPTLVKWGVSGFAIIIASNQLGIDTTIITVAVASVFFSVGLAAALLAGLGGRGVAEQIAAGRALRQLIAAGDALTIDGVENVVVAIGSTTTQFTRDGASVLVPNTDLLASHMAVVTTDERPTEIEDT